MKYFFMAEMKRSEYCSGGMTVGSLPDFISL